MDFIINLPLLSLTVTVPLRPIILIFLMFLLPAFLLAQKTSVKGRVTDSTNKPIELVNVAVLGEKSGTTTDYQGRYRLEVPAGTEITLAFSFIGFADKKIQLKLEEGEIKELDVNLKSIATQLPGFEVTDERLRTESMVRLNPRDALAAPSLNQSISDILVTLPGVTSSSELSSQYSVRG